MSKRLVDLSEAFDIIDWNILLLSLEHSVRLSGNLLMILSNLGIGKGVVICRTKLSWEAMGILPMVSAYFPSFSGGHNQQRSGDRAGGSTSVTASRQIQQGGSGTALVCLSLTSSVSPIKSLTAFMLSF